MTGYVILALFLIADIWLIKKGYGKEMELNIDKRMSIEEVKILYDKLTKPLNKKRGLE